MTTPFWYDNHENLHAWLGLGLTGLRQIIEARYDAGYERKEQLGEWCLLGFIWLDACGDTRCIKTGAPADNAMNRCPMVVSGAEMNTASMIMTGSSAFPDESSVCDRCSRGWTLQNLRDHYPYRANDDKICHRHKRCQELLVIQQESEELRKIVDDAGIEVLSTALIPSQYDGDTTYFGPWMVVTTPHGRLELGWRKRVISIDWKKMDIVVPATLFAAEDAKRITRLEAGIHAYGVEHAVDILRRVWSCAMKSSENAS